MHLLLYCSCLVSMQCIVEIDDRIGCKDLELIVPCVLQSLENLKLLVSTLNCPWRFLTLSLHVHSKH